MRVWRCALLSLPFLQRPTFHKTIPRVCASAGDHLVKNGNTADVGALHSLKTSGSALLRAIEEEFLDQTDEAQVTVSTAEVMHHLASAPPAALVECYRSFRAQGVPFSEEALFQILLSFRRESGTGDQKELETFLRSFLQDICEDESHTFLDANSKALLLYSTQTGVTTPLLTTIMAHPSFLVTTAINHYLDDGWAGSASVLRILSRLSKYGMMEEYGEDLIALHASPGHPSETGVMKGQDGLFLLRNFTPSVDYLLLHWELYWLSVSDLSRRPALEECPVTQGERTASESERQRWREATATNSEEAVEELTRSITPSFASTEFTLPPPVLLMHLSEHSRAMIRFFFQVLPIVEKTQLCAEPKVVALLEQYSRLECASELELLYRDILSTLRRPSAEGGVTLSAHSLELCLLLLRRCVMKASITAEEARHLVSEFFSLPLSTNDKSDLSLLCHPDVMRALLQKEWSRGELRFWTASLLENGPSPPQQEWSRILNRHDTSTGRVLACPSLEQLPAFQASVAHIGVHLLQHKRTEEVYQLVSAFVCANIPLFESSNVKSVLESFFQKLFPAEEEQIKLLKMVLLACEGNTRVRLIASLFFEDVKGETADTPLLSSLPSITQEKTVAGSVGLRLSDEGLSLLQRIFHSLCLSPGELASAPLLLGDILSLTPAPHPLRAALLESFWRSVWTRVGITEERNGAAPISYSGWLEFLSHLPPHCAEDRHLTLCLYQSMAILSQMKTTAGNEGDGPSGLVDPSVETTVDREWIIQTAAAIVANFTALPPTAISPPMLLNWLVASGQFDVGQAVRYLLAQLQRAKEGGDQAKDVSFVYLAIPIDKIGNTSHLLRLLAALRYLERHETQHSTPHGMEHITYERIRTYVLHMWYVRALSCVFTFLQVNPVALSLSATTQSTLPSERRIPVECLAYFVLQECPLRSPYVSYTHPSHGTTDHTLDHLKKVFTVRHEASPGATPLPTGQGELDLTEASVSSHLYRDVASFTHSSLGSASPVLLHEGLLQDYVAMVAAKLQESHLSARETALETVLEGFLQTVKRQDTMRNRNAAQGDLPDTRLTISTPEFSALCNALESLLHKS